MDVKFETLVSVWDNQIPKLLIDFVNTAVFTRSENELRTAIAYLSESTDFDKFFAYGSSFLVKPTAAKRYKQVYGEQITDC